MRRALLFVAWLFLAVMGAVGLYERLTTGHQLAGYGSYIPWGLWVAGYIYFIGLSAGSFVLASVVYVARVKLLEPLAPFALLMAVVTLLMALMSIGMDLGHLNRAGEVMPHANLRSMMAWMIFMYSTYFFVIIVENVLAMVPRVVPWRGRPGYKGLVAKVLGRLPEHKAEKWLHRLGPLGVPLATAFHGGVGALFATVGARPYWHHGLFPVIFLIGALASGCGGLAALFYAVWPNRDDHFKAVLVLLGKMVLYLLLFDVLLEWAEFSIPMWQGISHELEIFDAVLYGPYWWNFWIVHILLGVAIPIALLVVAGKRPGAIALGGGLVAATFISVRLNMVIPPLTQPLIEGLGEAFVSPRTSYEYFPTLFEWQVLAGVFAMGIGVAWLAMRFLPVLPRPSERYDVTGSPIGVGVEHP